MSNNMDKQSYIDEAEKELLHTYNRFSLVLDHGEGVHLYDTDGNAYLDFAAGIAVCALGYSNERHKEALKAQVDKLLHTSNLYYNAPVIEAADKVLNASKMDRIFFTNSGTEAIEGAIKAAKKYAFTRDGHAGHEIIAMNHSFHGRSIGALSVTGNAHYQEPFEPLMPGVKFADFNDHAHSTGEYSIRQRGHGFITVGYEVSSWRFWSYFYSSHIVFIQLFHLPWYTFLRKEQCRVPVW